MNMRKGLDADHVEAPAASADRPAFSPTHVPSEGQKRAYAMADNITTEDYFEACGYEPDDLIAVCWKVERGRALRFAHVRVKEAPRVIAEHFDTDVWITGGTFRHVPKEGRGVEGDMGRIPALWADLDLKPGSFASRAEVDIVVAELSTLLGVTPCAIVASGGGYQPRWRIEGDLDKKTLERFGLLVKKVCAAHGFHADSVYDLARVLRAPGTTNYKYDPPRPTSVEVLTGGVLSLEELDDVLDAYAIELPASAAGGEDPDPIEPSRGNAYAKAAIEGVLRDLESSATWPVGYSDDRGRGWEKFQADSARRLHAIAAADWNDYTAAHIAPSFFASAPIGGDWTIRNVQSKWESEARKAVPAPKPAKLGNGVMFGPKAESFDTEAPSFVLVGEESKVSTDVEDVHPFELQSLDVGNPKEMSLFIKENVGRGKLSGFFLRGNELVRTPRVGEDGYIPPKEGQEDGPAQVRSVTAQALAAHLTYSFDTYVLRKVGKGDQAQYVREPALFPFPAAQTAIEGIDNMDALRCLKGVTHTPLVRPDGSILTTPGYDPATGLLYLPDPDLKVPEVPDAPDGEQIALATKLLTDVVADFPFVTDSDRMNYLGLLVTPVLRGLCPPPYKLGAMTAPSPGSGKTLLADILRTVHGGVFRSEMPGDDAELKKQISAILDVTTGPVIHFDNLTGVLRSSTLAGLLTSKVWSDRRLGSSTNISTPNDRLWVITGNNLSIGGDIARRTITVTIDPRMPDPHLRTGYGIDPLLPYVETNRGDLLWAMLTLVRAWHVAGRPSRGKRSSDSFGAWIEAVDGILANAGIAGQFDASETQSETSSVDDGEWGEFLHAVYAVIGTDTWLAKDVLGRIKQYGPGDPRCDISLDKLPSPLLDKLRSNDNILTLNKSFGRWLSNHNGRYAAHDGVSYVVRQQGTKDGAKMWRVEQA